jgi:hypothetical protein
MEINFLDEKTAEFKIELESEEVSESIVSSMIQNGFSIAEIKRISMSLEDVFASFTRGKSYSGLASSDNTEFTK